MSKQDMPEDERIEWFLNELARQDDIEDDEVDIYGETESGLEGSCSVKINKIAGDAAGLIKRLKETSISKQARDELEQKHREELQAALEKQSENCICGAIKCEDR